MNVAILYGGNSIESHYSVKSATNLKLAMLNYGYNIIMVDVSDSNWLQIFQTAKVDILIDLIYGCPGQEGTVKGLADQLNIKYLGSNLFTHALIKDKYLAKLVALDNNVCTPDFVLASKEDYVQETNRINDDMPLLSIKKKSEKRGYALW